jgi:cell division protein FtsL
MLLGSGLLVAGCVYAIYQHAEAVGYGYKTQQLLREREQLDREKRQLELQHAHYRSPQVLERAAQRLGLVRPDSSQVIVASADGELKRWAPRSRRVPVPGNPAGPSVLPVTKNEPTAEPRSRPRRVEAGRVGELRRRREFMSSLEQ